MSKNVSSSRVLKNFADALRAAPRSVRGLASDTRRAGCKRGPGSKLIVQRAAPGLPAAARGGGRRAAPTVRWCCPRTRSMARLQRLQLSAAVSSVKNGAAICQTGHGLFRTADGERPDGRCERHGTARRRRVAPEVLSRARHTRSVARRDDVSRRKSQTPRRLPRRLPRLRQGPVRHD